MRDRRRAGDTFELPLRSRGGVARTVGLLIAGAALVGGCDRGVEKVSDAPPPSIAPVENAEGSVELVRELIALPESDDVPGWDERDDPSRDGWASEALHDEVKARLKKVGELISSRGAPPPTDLARIIDPGFRGETLRPKVDSAPSAAGYFSVARARAAPAAPDESDGGGSETAGVARFVTALRPLRDRLAGAIERRVEMKVVRVVEEGGTVASTEHVSIAATRAAGPLEIHARWRTRWRRAPSGDLRLASIAVGEHEETEAPAPLFEEVTPSVLGANESYSKHLLFGYNHWAQRIQDGRSFNLLGTPGIAVGDVNGDGLDDLFLSQEGGLPNRLYRQNLDGTATDASRESGVDWLESTRGVLLVDLDGDGDQDLAAGTTNVLVLAANDGRGRFDVRATLSTCEDSFSLAAADYDRDGDLDIYVCGYNRSDLAEESGIVSIGVGEDFVYHDANSGAPNTLFRNDRTNGTEWQFTDATKESGLDENNRRFSFAAAWEDYDGDGDDDLYVANDFGRNTLYENQLAESGTARFIDVAAARNAEDSASGMSVTWADFDRDGRMDVYVSNMFSAAGSRVTGQAEFKPNSRADVRSRLRRFSRGNTLLRATPDGSFEDVSEDAGVLRGRWAWSSNFVDVDLDGWEDLIVANGYITTEDTGDL